MSSIAADPDMRKMREFGRLVNAHADRRQTFTMFVAHLPHQMDPGQFGAAEDCPWCKNVNVSKKGEEMLQDLQMNGSLLFFVVVASSFTSAFALFVLGGFFYSPSRDEENAGAFNTLLQEQARCKNGQKGSSPDELLDLARDPAPSVKFSVFPTLRTCPFRGCWHFNFRNPSECERHCKAFHPGQLKQWFADRNINNGVALTRPHVCAECVLGFTNRSWLKLHQESYGHLSKQATSSRANRLSRQGQQPPPKPPPRQLNVSGRGELPSGVPFSPPTASSSPAVVALSLAPASNPAPSFSFPVSSSSALDTMHRCREMFHDLVMEQGRAVDEWEVLDPSGMEEDLDEVERNNLFTIGPEVLVFVVFRLDDSKASGAFPGLLCGTVSAVRLDKQDDVVFNLKLTPASRCLLTAATKEMSSIRWSTKNLIAADMHIVEAECLPEILNLIPMVNNDSLENGENIVEAACLPETLNLIPMVNSDSLEDEEDSEEPPTIQRDPMAGPRCSSALLEVQQL
jgi:hypothetical protein